MNGEHAAIAKQVIEVDAELQKHAVKRTLMVEDNHLIAYVAVSLTAVYFSCSSDAQ